MLRAALVLAFVVVSGRSPAQAADVDAAQMVDRVVEAYGGAGVLAGVQGYRAVGTVRAHARGETGGVVRVSQGAQRLKILIHYPTAVEIRVLDGEHGWKGQPQGGLVPVRGPMLDAMILQAARANVPWLLAQLRSQVRLAASTDEGPVLEVDLRPGLRVRVVLDPRTYRVVRAESELSSGSLRMEFVTHYSDFRRVDGILFPFQEERFVGEVHTATVRFDTLQLNPDDDEARLPSVPPRSRRSPHPRSAAADAVTQDGGLRRRPMRDSRKPRAFPGSLAPVVSRGGAAAYRTISFGSRRRVTYCDA